MIFKQDLQDQIIKLKHDRCADSVTNGCLFNDLERQIQQLHVRYHNLEEAYNNLRNEQSNLVAMTAADFNTMKRICRLKDHIALKDDNKPQSAEWFDVRRQIISADGYIYSHKDAGGNEYYIKPDPTPKVKAKLKKKSKKGRK